MNGHADSSPVESFDVVIIGAGISGINAAYRVQTQLGKDTTYAILDQRGAIGGTWDFFKYPGLRSDSDLYTFGFAWRPWKAGHAIAEAPMILEYLNESAKAEGIDKHIRFHHKVVAADWSSKELKWTLTAQVGEKTKQYKAGFIILGTGYYNYDEPLDVEIPGLKNFKGTVVHPQFWPENLDYANKDVVIVGSGATAITILPSMAKTANRVTIVQRSPSYVFSLPNRDDPITKLLQLILPSQMAHSAIRWKWMMQSYFFFYFCRTFPNAARRLISVAATKQLPKNLAVDPHFKPLYNPWEQRLCVAPDGDFYKALRQGKADMATGQITTMTADSVRLASGQEIKADIIITATGLKIQMAGGIKPTIDGEPLIVADKFMWKGVMLQDLPNASFVIGYTNASWTLGADATAQLVTRLIRLTRSKGARAAVPRVEDPDSMEKTPMLNLNSTYIQRATSIMPKTGKGQWAPRSHYMGDIREAKRGDIETGLEFLYETPESLAHQKQQAEQAANGGVKATQARI